MSFVYTSYMPENELIQLLRNGDKRAFNYLYGNYSSTLYGTILFIVRDHHSAEDVLQVTFVKIWQKIATYNGSKGRLYTWMSTIARNTAIDHLKCKKQHTELTPATCCSHTTTTGTDLIGIHRLIDQLADKHREILMMIYFRGYSIKETADHFVLPEGTVKTRLRTSLILLRGHCVVR